MLNTECYVIDLFRNADMKKYMHGTQKCVYEIMYIFEGFTININVLEQ